MPAAYAHLTFGRHVLRALPEGSTRQLILNHIDLFEIGLQGPDILFFYHPLGHHPVNRIGHSLHDESGASFLARPVCCGADDAGLAYLLGFICHYALDSECHTLVEYYMEKTGRGHSELETDLDRVLLARSGRDPLRTPPSAYIANTSANAAVIAPFYGVGKKQVKTALTSMKVIGQTLTPSNPVKHALLTRGIRLLGEHHLARELVMDWTPDPIYEPSNRAIIARMKEAVPVAIALMENFIAWRNGEEGLSQRFERTFSFDTEELALLKERTTYV